MYARSTTVRGDPQKVDAGIAFVRDEVMPTVAQMGGFVGLSMLADRTSGRCIVTAAWDELEAMQASREPMRPIRERSREVFGGDFEVHEWEIALLHRLRPSEPGACARVVWTRTEPERLGPLLELVRTVALPRTEQSPGFCSLSLLRDPRAGTSVTSTTYESREALAAARDAASALEAELHGQVAFEVTDTAEFEVVMAHLRVPETV